MTNEECSGYAIIAMERAGMDAEEIKLVYQVMLSMFDRYTPYEAEEMADKVMGEIYGRT